MKNIFITGATGNVGMEVIKALHNIPHEMNVFAGVRDLQKDRQSLEKYNVKPMHFDFLNPSTFEPAYNICDILFLLRPPQISDSKKYFKPLIAWAKSCKIQHIVFLSVQGVEKSSIIPHHQIEKMIVESGISYTFLRPAYFMQNFATTLKSDLINKKRIFLPAGKAKFTLIDVEDIGTLAAKILLNPPLHKNKSYVLTCYDKLTFQEMADKLSRGLGIKIEYISPNLLRFIKQKLTENVPFGYILVLIMLHYLPRFQKAPAISNDFELLTGKTPTTFEQFVTSNKLLLLS
jgi:uncharacterized protein YbjT (DUF2867 family)